MKLFAIKLAVAVLTFVVGLICVQIDFTNNKSTLKQNVALSLNEQLPPLSLCEVAASPNLYSKKVLEIRANQLVGFLYAANGSGSLLLQSKCVGKKLTEVRVVPNENLNFLNKFFEIRLDKFDAEKMEIKIIGQVKAKTQNDLALFEIEAIDITTNAKPIYH